MQESIRVRLGERAYDILLGGVMDQAGPRVREATGARRALVLTDENVGPLYAARVAASLESAGLQTAVYVLPAGEQTKCMERLGAVYARMAEAGLSRTDVVVALGGGVIGDLGGFAASTFLRGVHLVQIPTTLLAQVDSSIGGKTAIDIAQGKNLVGSFYQPACVLIDPCALSTLPARVFCDGMGEVVKYALAFDEKMLPLLEDPRAHLHALIRRSLEIKRGIVERDERDTGERMLLNFGHTLGHAIEAAQGYAVYTHGEAVAAGMCLMCKLTERQGISRAGTAARVEAVCRAQGLPTSAERALWPAMRQALRGDKKHLDGVLNAVVLDAPGSARVQPMEDTLFEGVVKWLT